MTPDHPAPGPGTTAAATWAALAEATTRRTAYTLATLATVDASASPRLRAVILRDCDPEAGSLAFATDARSAKIAEIQQHPRVALTVWDEGTGVQVRLEGRATVVADPEQRRRRWDALGPRTRRGYGSPSSPGTPLAPGAQPAAPDEDEDAWFDRFAWVEVRVDRIDRLDISTDPHERVVLTRADATWTGGRVVP
ncbi:pyridoxamine 5'-phosphate oxidase family protein [Cellulomonas sp. Marseille-Q8402]